MRPSITKMYRTSILSSSLLFLSACGGGGVSSPEIQFGSSTTNTSTNTTTETPSANLPTVDISKIDKADPGSSLANNWQQGVFMEIYVRGYKDSNGDGIGDLQGITQSLDYLQELGIKGLWLMPISKSEDRDHGYAVKDYRGIETDYGTLADLDELLKQAHARGIGVILDYVMNHSANTHPLFVNSADTKSNVYRSWYVWNDVAPTGWNIFGGNPWNNTKNGAYFAAFYSGMPDFNLRNPDVVEFHQNNLRFWLNRGVDGFRFDAVGNLIENGAGAWEGQPESVALMGKVRENITQYDKRMLVCEAPGNPLAYAAANSCGNAFGFGHNYDIIKAAKGQSSAIRTVADYFNANTGTISTMVSNHDEFAGARLWDQVGGDLAQYKLAAATYLLQPGTPYIYYGEEIGMGGANNLSGDHKLRTPMSWTNHSSNAGFTSGTPFRALSANVTSNNVAAQKTDNNSLYHFYKALINLRNQRSSLKAGNYGNIIVTGNVLSFQRQSGAEKTLVILNYGASSSELSLSGLTANSTANALYPANANSPSVDGNGQTKLTLAPQQILVFDLQ